MEALALALAILGVLGLLGIILVFATARHNDQIDALKDRDCAKHADERSNVS